MIPTSTGTPCSFSQATRTAESPITDAMERSISPLTMTNVIASTTIAFSMLSSRRLIWFCGFRYPGTAPGNGHRSASYVRHSLEPETLTGDDGDVPAAHGEADAGQAGQGAAQRKRDDGVARDRAAGDMRRVGVGANRGESATVRQI